MKHLITNNLWILSGLLCLILVVGNTAQAHQYRARLDIAEWHLQPSRLECRMWQRIPRFGDAVFVTEAGDDVRFHLEPLRRIKYKGEAEFRSFPPEWKYDIQQRYLGKVRVKPGEVPFVTDHDLASRLLAELQLGMFQRISEEGWYPQHGVNIEVSAVNFPQAYQDYQNCVASLYPANFRQLERSIVYFETNKWEIRDEFRDLLELIWGYIKLDDEVRRIYIDGHADARGPRDYNYDLSRKRAEMVYEYLLSIGVPEQIIVLRYHGERFPAANNTSQSKMALNRRVTLRLEKER